MTKVKLTSLRFDRGLHDNSLALTDQYFPFHTLEPLERLDYPLTGQLLPVLCPRTSLRVDPTLTLHARFEYVPTSGLRIRATKSLCSSPLLPDVSETLLKEPGSDLSLHLTLPTTLPTGTYLLEFYWESSLDGIEWQPVELFENNNEAHMTEHVLYVIAAVPVEPLRSPYYYPALKWACRWAAGALDPEHATKTLVQFVVEQLGYVSSFVTYADNENDQFTKLAKGSLTFDLENFIDMLESQANEGRQMGRHLYCFDCGAVVATFAAMHGYRLDLKLIDHPMLNDLRLLGKRAFRHFVAPIGRHIFAVDPVKPNNVYDIAWQLNAADDPAACPHVPLTVAGLPLPTYLARLVHDPGSLTPVDLPLVLSRFPPGASPKPSHQGASSLL